MHWRLVLFVTHVPPLKQTFGVHINPKSTRIESFVYGGKSSLTYLSNNRTVQNPVGMSTWNCSVDPVERKCLDWNRVVFDNYLCIDIDCQLNNLDKCIDNRRNWHWWSIDTLTNNGREYWHMIVMNLNIKRIRCDRFFFFVMSRTTCIAWLSNQTIRTEAIIGGIGGRKTNAGVATWI